MFLAGANGKTPEFRAPSIKGAMRFWWRAMHSHLGLSELHRKEGLIFGNNAQRSCFSIRVTGSRFTATDAKPVPHKDYPLPAIPTNTRFEVSLCWSENPTFSFDNLCTLFELTALLGGLGKRSRRAMGGFAITAKVSDGQIMPLHTDISTSYLHGLLKQFSPHFQLLAEKSTIINTYQGVVAKYPWIKQVEIGASRNRSVPNHTSSVTHQLKIKHGQAYEPNLGHAFKGRFASPVFVSVVMNANTPIITSLHTEPDKGHSLLDTSIQNEFKQSIL